MNAVELASMNQDQANVFERSGLNQAFVRKALTIPSTTIWNPTVQELKDANVITSVSDGTQFAVSGYGGNLPKSVFEEQLSKNVPILMSLKTKYPADFHIIADEYYKGYMEGKTEDEENNILRYLSYVVVRKYIKTSDDKAATAFGGLLVDELNALKARDPVQCAKFGSTAGADPDIQYSFSTALLGRFQAVGASAIAASGVPNNENTNVTQPIIARAIKTMQATVSPKLLSLLSVKNPTAQQSPEYCLAITAFYQQLLMFRPSDAAAVLRIMF